MMKEQSPFFSKNSSQMTPGELQELSQRYARELMRMKNAQSAQKVQPAPREEAAVTASAPARPAGSGEENSFGQEMGAVLNDVVGLQPAPQSPQPYDGAASGMVQSIPQNAPEIGEAQGGTTSQSQNINRRGDSFGGESVEKLSNVDALPTPLGPDWQTDPYYGQPDALQSETPAPSRNPTESMAPRRLDGMESPAPEEPPQMPMQGGGPAAAKPIPEEDPEEKELPLTDTGALRVQVTTAQEAVVITGAVVSIMEYKGEIPTLLRVFRTDASGLTPTLELPAPDRKASLQPEEGDSLPFAVYYVSVDAQGYFSLRDIPVQVFGGTTTLFSAKMIPLLEQ